MTSSVKFHGKWKWKCKTQIFRYTNCKASKHSCRKTEIIHFSRGMRAKKRHKYTSKGMGKLCKADISMKANIQDFISFSAKILLLLLVYEGRSLCTSENFLFDFVLSISSTLETRTLTQVKVFIWLFNLCFTRNFYYSSHMHEELCLCFKKIFHENNFFLTRSKKRMKGRSSIMRYLTKSYKLHRKLLYWKEY